MNKSRSKKLHPPFSVVVLTLAVGALAAAYPAYAQQDALNQGGNARPQRQWGRGGAREAGPVQPPSEFDEQAKSILDKTSRLYRNLKSLTIKQSVYAGRPSKRVIVHFQAPQNLVIASIDSKDTKTTAYYDYGSGNLTSVRDFGDKVQYQVEALNRGGEQPSNPRATLSDALGQYLAGFLDEGNLFGRLSVETVKYGGVSEVNGVPVDNIVLSVRGRGQQGATTVTYSIGKQDSLLYKVARSSLSSDGTPVVYSETYTDQKVDASLPAGTFQLTLPRGAEKVDQLSRYRGKQVAVGDTPFAFNGKDADGKQISLEQYKGKVVLIDFWATWCGPCRAELPNLKAAYSKYKDQGFDVVGISLDETAKPLKPFIAKESLGWHNIYDGFWKGPIASQYNVSFVPTTILIGRDGKVAAVNARGADLAPAIEAALTNLK